MVQEFTVPITKKSLPTRGLQTSPTQWIIQKSQRDAELWGNTSKLWIVENKLYDLTPYVHSHPGGSHWISMTKGQDITQHFITHHLNQDKARAVLDKYFVGEAKIQQKPRFTFEENGLYRKVKKRLLETYSASALQDSSQSVMQGTLFISLWLLCFLLMGIYQSTLFAIICGALIYPIVGVAHNFVHMRDHPFRFLWMATGFTHRQWQQMHCLSHHSYANTLIDYQIQGLEPVIYYLKVSPKNPAINWLFKQILLLTATPINIFLKLVMPPFVKKRQPEWFYLVPLMQIPFLWVLTGNIISAVKLFLIVHVTFSFIFFKLSFLGHRTGREWTEGNQEIRDFAQHQIYASSDVQTNQCKGFWSYVLYAGFNFHAIHHLFPTVDNHYLPEASQILEEQAEKKGIKLNKSKNLWDGLAEIEKNFFNRKEWKKGQ